MAAGKGSQSRRVPSCVCAGGLSHSSPRVSLGGGVGAGPPLFLHLWVSLTTLECLQSLHSPHPLLSACIDQTQMAVLLSSQKT